jgi:Na+/phosphate symporter
MYKSILLTDQELELLSQVLTQYLSKKSDKNDQNIINAHIILRHICDKTSKQNSNQIAFYGK